ncbi:MAG: Crp/Fnr family transcriptional regulator [Myxococcota bacterium]|nr:Crp/Fnr family transcriptional regulator [Myxococcota bacterium]MDW8364151.1 Crp/Fnr family transcriptional regulator [Myxococcales bacterium]
MTDADSLFARFGVACPAGTILFHEDEPGNTMYVIQSGQVRIRKHAAGGEKTLALLGPGEFFGEMAILNAKPRTATAEAVTDCRLLVIDARTFEQMVVSNAEIAVRLIRKLARRLDSANELIEILMHRDPKARVILGLSRQAELRGRARPDGSVLVPIDVADLAAEIGLEPEHVEPVIHRLVRLRMVEHDPEGFVVTDVRRLHEFLEFLEMRSRFGEAGAD